MTYIKRFAGAALLGGLVLIPSLALAQQYYSYDRDQLYCAPSAPTAGVGEVVRFRAYGGDGRYAWTTGEPGLVSVGDEFDMRFFGPGTGVVYVESDDQEAICSVAVGGSAGYSYPGTVPAYPGQQPYITLTAVPYTGLDLGMAGTLLYWGFLSLWTVFAVYLLAIKRVQNGVVRKLIAAFDR